MVTLLLTTAPTQLFASEVSDMKESPLEDIVQSWIDQNIIGNNLDDSVQSTVKEITGFSALEPVKLFVDEHLVDLATLKASGKLPTEVMVTDGATTV